MHNAPPVTRRPRCSAGADTKPWGWPNRISAPAPVPVATSKNPPVSKLIAQNILLLSLLASTVRCPCALGLFRRDDPLAWHVEWNLKW